MSYFKPTDNNAPTYVQPPGGQPPAYGGQPPVYGGQPPVYGGQPPAYGGQPPAYGGQPPAYGGQPPYQGGNGQYQGYPPIQGPYQAPAQAPSNQTNINFNFTPGVVVANDSICIFCRTPYVLLSSRRIGWQTLIAVLLLILIFWPLCWLPLIIDDCKDKHYHCSQCGALIYKKSFTMCS
ncbi:unnamed protein product [Paramecium primaurelia]|uniref:LITAF domain-containing protein n=1 Tax=Paramecium primaurelia TaxID=5886 RepID=A0A8S1LZI3_PARPR|nr:unnamed protein product [Paramecium primaurelia]